jgi:small redox-active disulfide protein 2
MDIKILGVGCPRCKKLEQQVRNVVAENNIIADIEKITDVQEMVQYGIMATPGLVINGKVKSSGLTLRDDQILNWLKEESDEIK